MEIMHTSAHRPAALVWSPHPLMPGEGRVIEFTPPTGAESLRAYLTRCGVDLSGPVIVTVDRTVIPRDWLTRVRPKPGTLITVRAAVADGGGGSQVLAVVAMIALMIVAPYAGAALASAAMGGGAAGAIAATTFIAGTTITGAMIGQTVVTIGGAMLISALTPRPKMDLGRALASPAASSTYSLSGGSNAARPYEPLALTLGTHRVFFDLASRPYTTFEGDDQYLNQVFHVGLHGPYGPVRVTDLRIGDTPLASYSDVETEFAVDAMPALVAYNVDTVAGASVTVASGPLLRTTSIDTTRIEVDLIANLFAIGGSGAESSHLTLSAEYRPVGGSTWSPFVIDALRGYYTHYWAHGVYQDDGTWVQDFYDSNRSPTAHTDGAGGWRWLPMADRDISDPAPSDQLLTLDAIVELDNASAAPLRRTLSANVPAGQYEVRITRLTADSTDSRVTSDLSVSAIKSYQVQPGNFAGQCFMAVKVRASGQLNGSLARLSGLVSQPIGNRIYGSTAADVYLLYARGYRIDGRLIWGAGLDDAEIDLDAILAWKIWCIGKSLTCNLHIDSTKSVWDVLQAIARCGRASPSWHPGKLSVLWDAEDQPIVALFGPSNIARASFEVAYASEAAADEITLSFVNADNDYSAETIRLMAPGVTSPTKSASTELWGCTNRDQALRELRLLLAHQIYRPRAITWIADMEGLVVTRGDVVALSHDLTQWGTSGRLVAGTTTTLHLDRAITLDPAGNWITVVDPVGTLRTCRVQHAAGPVDTLTLLDALPVAPDSDNPIDWRWLSDYQATPGKRVKITDIKPASMHEVRITAMDDPDEYYAAEAGTYDPPEVRKWLADVPTLGALQFAEELVRASAGFAVVLTVTWPETGPLATRRVRYRLNAGIWIDAGSVDTSTIRLNVPDTGTLDIVVTGYTGAGQTSAAATSAATHIIAGRYAAPPAPTGFAAAYLPDGTRAFTWSLSSTVPPDVQHLEIRYASSSGTAWASMALLGVALYKSGRTETATPAAGTWTFEARLVDGTGLYSTTGQRITVTLGEPAGVLVGGVTASSIVTAITHYNAGNNRNATTILAPTIVTDGTALDHTLQADGSADISFEWQWGGNEGDIDGWLVFVRQSASSAGYTLGTTPADETVYTCPAAKRAFVLYGTAADRHYTFGVQAYRTVDKDINASGVIKSVLAQPTASGENPYRPTTQVAFAGNVTGTVNNLPADTINVWSSIAGAGKPADNATVGANASNLNIGLGVNLLPNTEFIGGFAPAVLGWNPGGVSPLALRVDDVWRPKGGQALEMFQPGRSGNIHNIGADTYLNGSYGDYHYGIPVTAGKRYEFSAKLAAHRCDYWIAIGFFDAAGTILDEFGSGFITPRLSGGPTFSANAHGSGWTHAVIFRTAPAGAAFACVYWRKSDTDVGQADSYAWLCQPFFGEATAAQTVPSTYSPGYAKGAFSSLSQLDPTNSATFVAPGSFKTPELGTGAASESWVFFDAVGISYSNLG